MYNDNTETLTSIHNLITNGKFRQALDIIHDFENTSNHLQVKEKLQIILAKAMIYIEMEKYHETLDIIDEVLNNSQNLESNVQRLEAVFTKAKALSRIGEIGKSLAYVKMGEKMISKLTNISESELKKRKADLYFEKAFIFEREEDLKNALDNYLYCQAIRRELDDREGLADSNNKIARIYFKMGDVVRALLIFKQSLDMYKEINDENGIAETMNNIGKIYLWKGEYGPALENSLQSLALSEAENYANGTCNSLITISEIYIYIGELNRSHEYLERGLAISEELQDEIGTGKILSLLSKTLLYKGELNQATNYLTQAQEIFRRKESKSGISDVLENLGILLYQRGEYDQAEEYLLRCYENRKFLLNIKNEIQTLFWLITVLIENNKIESAQEYLKIMRNRTQKVKNDSILLNYRLASALILKRSSNIEIINRAKKILSEIQSSDIIDFKLSYLSLLNLIELSLKEIQLTKKKDQLKNIDGLIKKHLEMGKSIESQIMIAENFWLTANSDLLKLKINEAKMHLEQAEQITEEKGLRRIGVKISQALDIINKNLDNKEETSEQPKPLLTDEEEMVDSEVVKMIDKRTIEIPKMHEEEPVLLIIVYEGGVTVYSKKFSTKELIDEMFVGGFLTAIDAFMHQTFATGGSIERIQHQEYTLLLKVENPLLFCYVFKGQSFTSIQKLDKIVTELKKSATIWNALIKNQGEQLNFADKELIGNLADEIFVDTDE